jgi:hypothetical protein
MLSKTLLLALVASVAALPTEPSSTSSTAPPPPAATDTKALYADLFTSPTEVGRYQRLLTNPATGALLSKELVTSAIVFDYNKTAAQLGPPTDKGGKVTAAVAATFPILVGQKISTVAAFLNPCG